MPTNQLNSSRFRHTVRRPGQIVCPNSDSVCPNSDKIYLMVVTFRFLLLFFAYYDKRDSFLPSGSCIALFWLPAETLSLKRLLGESTAGTRPFCFLIVFLKYGDK